MLRLKVLVSVVPLVVAALLADSQLVTGAHPCIAIGNESLQIVTAPWHADLHVSFTDDPAAANVRVQITDNADDADFAVVDDVDGPETDACAVTPATQFVAISAKASRAAPMIYLSHDGPADYRIFVKSSTFTAREAAALIVGAASAHPHLASASL
ncbi:MAG TPA: hypothetical protein VHB49_19770 [Bradyrhizobium sp.]|nr:hypothetical protein [Bradyrhizobium sp.]